MLYRSWDMGCDGYNCYFSFWAIFCPFIPVTARKMKISKKWKKHQEISSFYICVPKIMIRRCTVPEIWCARDWWTDRQTEKVTYRGGCPTKNKKTKTHTFLFLKLVMHLGNWLIFPLYKVHHKYLLNMIFVFFS